MFVLEEYNSMRVDIDPPLVNNHPEFGPYGDCTMAVSNDPSLSVVKEKGLSVSGGSTVKDTDYIVNDGDSCVFEDEEEDDVVSGKIVKPAPAVKVNICADLSASDTDYIVNDGGSCVFEVAEDHVATSKIVTHAPALMVNFCADPSVLSDFPKVPSNLHVTQIVNTRLFYPTQWSSKWAVVDEAIMSLWKFKSVGEARDAASHTLFINENRLFCPTGSRNQFKCRTCGIRIFILKKKEKFFQIDLISQHSPACKPNLNEIGVTMIGRKDCAKKIVDAMISSDDFINQFRCYDQDYHVELGTKTFSPRKSMEERVFLINKTLEKVFKTKLCYGVKSFLGYLANIDAQMDFHKK